MELRNGNGLPGKRVRAVAEELDHAVSDERVTDGRFAFKRFRCRIRLASRKPRIHIPSAFFGKFGAGDQYRRGKGWLFCVAVPLPVVIDLVADLCPDTVTTPAPWTLEHEHVPLTVAKDSR